MSARRGIALRHRLAFAGLLLMGVVVGASAAPTTRERLTALAEDTIRAVERFEPIRATYLGIEGHDAELDLPSESAREASIARLKAWGAQLDAILRSAGRGISLVDRNDATLLRAQFDAELNELLVRQTDRKDMSAPSLTVTDVVYTQFLHLPVPGREGATSADLTGAWGDLIARLAKGPAYIAAGQKMVTRPGKLFGTVGAKQIAGMPEFLNGALTDAAQAQLAGEPALLRRFTTARDALLVTLAETQKLIEQRASSWPDNHAIGKAAYEQMLRQEQLLPYGVQGIEIIARDALAHGWAEEAWLVALAKKRKQAFGAETGGGMAPSGPALIGYYRERITQLRRFIEEHELVTVPAWLGEMQVVETPPFLQPVSPGASMNSPRLFAKSTTGYYFITPPDSLEEAARTLDMNQDFDRDRILSTAAHEAMPGHFLQLSIAKRHPDLIRRMQSSSVFEEGWAFYGEEMFVRLGLYGDGLDARLFTARWERVRGARAIVDGRLASGEWTLPVASAFFETQSGFTKAASEAAVAGIALHPGYVISYTVGRLQLETLLAEYMRRTGERGSLRDFHDRLLSYGSVPFAIVGPELLADLDKPASAVRAAANY